MYCTSFDENCLQVTLTFTQCVGLHHEETYLVVIGGLSASCGYC